VLFASPYFETDFEAVGRACRTSGASLVVMDCLGYTLAMKAAVTRASGLPVLLARSLAARLAAELIL
jgi:protein AroM